MSVKKLIGSSVAAVAVVAFAPEAFATPSLADSISTVGSNIATVPTLIN